ncbi:MAG: pantoate--beta-alanine ligase [Deltaproteobacteria bacterium]|nr:MAG: pantoate--beta-alanine ligase [Deltaproteobacteria bacterium]
MKYFESVKEYLEFRKTVTDKKIGLVPTMGNLHEGHISLAQRSMEDNDFTVVTIFVNPKQFGPNEDFARYPRTMQKDGDDLKALEMRVHKKDSTKEIILLAPQSINEIYPEGFSTSVKVNGLTDKLCGLNRPTHFEGVTTVVYRLFKIAQADRAYFGQKDYQQFKVIDRMVIDLEIPVEMHMCPIVRDQDGLALSSRNQYLTPPEREKALVLPRTLKALSFLIERNPWSQALEKVTKVRAEALRDSKWQYLQFLDADTLEEINDNTRTILIAGAYQARGARLIDNILVERNA